MDWGTLVLKLNEHDQTDDRDLSILRKLAAGKTKALEIGCYLGASTVTILDAMGGGSHITVIDTFEDNENDDGMKMVDRLRKFNQRTKDYRGRVSTVIGKSPESLPDGRFDFIHIDGAHDYDSVCADLDAVVCNHIAAGGVLVIHDFDDSHPGVKAAVREYLLDDFEVEGRTAWKRF